MLRVLIRFQSFSLLLKVVDDVCTSRDLFNVLLPLQVRSYSAAQVGGMAKKKRVSFLLFFQIKIFVLREKVGCMMYSRHVLHIFVFILCSKITLYETSS